MIGSIFAGIKALSFVQKATGALSFIPGVGVLPGIVSAVCGAILGFLRMLFAGVTVMVANPVTLVTALCLGLGAFVYGIKFGRDWTKRDVEVVERQIADMKKSWKDANDRNANDLAAALLARQKAEDDARAIDKASREAAARAGRANAERLRNSGNAAPAANPASGWSLPGIPSLFKTN